MESDDGTDGCLIWGFHGIGGGASRQPRRRLSAPGAAQRAERSNPNENRSTGADFARAKLRESGFVPGGVGIVE